MASKNRRPNNVTFERIGLRINHARVPTIAQLHLAEASRIVTIIDEDVIRLDVYDAVMKRRPAIV